MIAARSGWEISGFTFSCLGKVRDATLALRALNSMCVPLRALTIVKKSVKDSKTVTFYLGFDVN